MARKKKAGAVRRECPRGQGRSGLVCLEVEETGSRIGRVFRVRLFSRKTGRSLGFLKNESCHVTRDPGQALAKIHRKDALDAGRWCAGRKPTWPVGRAQKAYARRLVRGG